MATQHPRCCSECIRLSKRYASNVRKYHKTLADIRRIGRSRPDAVNFVFVVCDLRRLRCKHAWRAVRDHRQGHATPSRSERVQLKARQFVRYDAGLHKRAVR